MNSNTVNRLFVFGAFALGLIAVVWVGWGFVGTSAIALAMTLAIGRLPLWFRSRLSPVSRLIRVSLCWLSWRKPRL